MVTQLRFIITLFLLLFITNTSGEVIVFKGGVQYNPVPIPTQDVTVPMLLKKNGAGRYRIRTVDINGELTFDCSDVPGCQPVYFDCAGIPLKQQLELNINRKTGKVEGRTRGQLSLADDFNFIANLNGDATCISFGGQNCGQLVVDLDARGTFSKPDDAASVGSIKLLILGSLVRDEENAQWVALSANATLGFALPDDVAEMLSAKCL